MKNKSILLLIVIVLCLVFYNSCFAETVEENSVYPSISFAQKNYKVGKGKTLQLEVESSGITEDMVELSTEWSSSKPEVATVKKGQVKGIKVGRCMVTCEKTYSNGIKIKAECSISVNELIKKISAPKSIVVGVSRTKKIQDVSFSPTSATVRKLKYTSSDTSIATVNTNGEITGISTGSCIVTIESTDGGTAKAEIKVNVPTLYSDKSEYTISSKKGLSIHLQCLNTSIDNIEVKNNSNKLFTVQKTTYDFVKGILKIELSPIKKGTGKIIITDKKSKDKLELNIVVAEKADTSYPNEVDIYEENAVVMNIDGIKLTSTGKPEWEESYDGTHYLTLHYVAENNTSRELSLSGDYTYVNDWRYPGYIHISLEPGRKGNCELTIYKMEDMGVYKLSDIKSIKLNMEIYDSKSYKTIADNIIAYMIYNPVTAQKVNKPDYNKNEYPQIPYKDLMRYPESFVGNSYSFTGYVQQVQKDDDLYIYRISSSGKSDNIVFVVVSGSSGIVRLIEDDKVSVAGTFLGLQSYTAVLGNEITIPLMIADKIIIK